MSWNNMRGRGAEIIIEGIKNNSTIEYIDMSYNLMGSYKQGKDPAIFSIAEMMNVKEIQYIDLSSNLIDQNGAFALAMGLRWSTNLERLILNGNHMGE